MADIETSCPHCRGVLSLPGNLRSEKLQCPICGNCFFMEEVPEPPEMPESFIKACPYCGEKLQLPDALRGSKTQCPACSNKFVIPEDDAIFSPAFSSPAIEMDIAEPYSSVSNRGKVVIIILFVLMFLIFGAGFLLTALR